MCEALRRTPFFIAADKLRRRPRPSTADRPTARSSTRGRSTAKRKMREPRETDQRARFVTNHDGAAHRHPRLTTGPQPTTQAPDEMLQITTEQRAAAARARSQPTTQPPHPQYKREIYCKTQYDEPGETAQRDSKSETWWQNDTPKSVRT